jgi:cell division protein FtsL
MKAPVARHERTGSQSTIFVICLIGVLISAMSLGSLRLYGLYLEHRLGYLTMRIESVNNRNSLLEERYSSLLSPSRIYNIAMTELKMVTASEVETIQLGGRTGFFVAASELQGTDIESVGSPGGFERIFVGTANAKD